MISHVLGAACNTQASGLARDHSRIPVEAEPLTTEITLSGSSPIHVLFDLQFAHSCFRFIYLLKTNKKKNHSQKDERAPGPELSFKMVVSGL